jgi:predicted DNA-binding transcriptional regulator AlpA
MISPKHRLIRKPEVKLRTGLKNTALWEAMKDGKFPKSVRLSEDNVSNAFGKGRYCGAVAWVEAEIDQWIESRMDNRNC